MEQYIAIGFVMILIPYMVKFSLFKQDEEDLENKESKDDLPSPKKKRRKDKK